jgi:hypothetical protein
MLFQTMGVHTIKRNAKENLLLLHNGTHFKYQFFNISKANFFHCYFKLWVFIIHKLFESCFGTAILKI